MKPEEKFLGLPENLSDFEKSKIVFLPVAYDGTSTVLRGSSNGPKAIIKAASNLELYDIETETEVYKEGICTLPEIKGDFSPEEMTQEVEKKVSEIIDKDKFLAVIGGEHSISIGAVKAFAKKHFDMCVLQLDAHADLKDEYDNSKFNHACTMARIKEITSIVQVGIRSMSKEETENMSYDNMFFAEDMIDDSWMEESIDRLKEKVYISLDLDVLDPSIMPSTGTPEPGGLDWTKLITFLRRVFKEKEVVGFDVVELCPNEQNKAPDFLTAKLIYKLLSYKFSK
jgi:agmatinase